MDTKVTSEAYLVSFVMDRVTHNSAITILEPLPDGGFKAIRIIRGKEAEALYDQIMSSGEVELNGR